MYRIALHVCIFYYTMSQLNENIKGDDFWQLANCNQENYNNVLPDWQDQMIDILKRESVTYLEIIKNNKE